MKGLSFPIKLSGSGGLKMTEGLQHKTDTLTIALNTKKFERIMNPDLGNTLDTSLFEDDDKTMESLLKYEVCNVLKEEGLNVLEKDINVIKEDDKVLVIVTEQGQTINLTLS